MPKLITILFLCLCIITEVKSQNLGNGRFIQIFPKNADKKEIESLRATQIDSIPDVMVLEGIVIRGVCKNFELSYLVFSKTVSVQTWPEKIIRALPNVSKRTPLLKITGNVLYDVNYRSRIDTPYAESNVYQHTLQTRLDVVYKDKYPFRIYLTARFSNSPFFRNYTDLNFQFNQTDFKRIIKKRLYDAVESHLASATSRLDSLKQLMQTKRIAIASLNRPLQKSDWAQKAVEEREKILFSKHSEQTLPDASVNVEDLKEQINWQDKFKFGNKKFESSNIYRHTGIAPANTDSKVNSFIDSLTIKMQKLDSLVAELEGIEKLYRKLKSAQELNLAALKKQVEGAKDVQALSDKLRQLNIPDTVLPKGYKTFYSIQSFSLGRSVADYSELSVKNISITGIQAEYNPRYYYALAAGKVDYRFRDYIVPNYSRSNQYVALARFGKGTKNGNHIIFTYYTGRRQFFNASVASQPNNSMPGYNLAGFTIEGLYKINKNIFLIAEIAKSTVPYYSLDSLRKKNRVSAISDFSERSNEAYSAKLFSYFPKSKTRFFGNLHYTGANFQSFSTFTTGAAQLRWQAKLEQTFFKNQLTVISSLQQNDYNNPFIATTYRSSSLLASIRANLRIKKWPVISAGYYPSYQLTKTDDSHYSESRYYMFTGSAGYYYRISEAELNSYVLYSRFYNEANDSGFVYYNSTNILLSQSVQFTKFSLTLNASLSTATDYNIYSVDNSGQFTINKFLAAGAGIKMIKHSVMNEWQWGYSGNLTIKIPKLGDIQLMMDKGFIPGLNRQLAENKMGRLTYYKIF